MMNIYAPRGTKVFVTKESLQNGYADEREKANSLLKVGSIYNVERTIVGNSYTGVALMEFPDTLFNSVFFEDWLYNEELPVMGSFDEKGDLI